jgi:molybdenum cofactor cytidylyltransferase
MLSAIVLAAGSSRRMGNKNKLLLPYNGKTVLATTTGNILAAGIEEVIVVTGHDATLVESAIRHLPVSIVHNSRYERGMTSSIQEGVRAAKGDGYMICLSDMVLITPGEYALLKKKFEEKRQSNSKCICLPKYKDGKGNPVIFSSWYKDAILQHEEREGCKQIIRSNEENLYWVGMPTDHVLRDMDSPGDYEALAIHH